MRVKVMNGKTENEKNETNNKNAPTETEETETDYKDKYIRLLAEFDNYRKFKGKEHDAVLYVNDELPEGKIVKVVRKGYKLDNVIIRHPQVVVSKGKAEDDNKKNDGDDVKSIKHERNKGNEDNGGG